MSHLPTRLIPLWKVSQVYRLPVYQILDLVRYLGMSPIRYEGEVTLTGKTISYLARLVSLSSRQHGDTLARLWKSFHDAPRVSREDFIVLRKAAA